ncbi:hypothetical protein ACFST9_23450 [Hymenobacter monticola]|uniref:T9SS C-terminal target domain-containing protein n=1 Tax=Hymenobacter monticola TaxID=1705399 RepID=A0ABY4B851_9BACT|nr:hypothetical protein [Hymenobacter monticola]UOE33943.1 hypothetical protein MTP16_22870 [Hymenobacter monticola]
MRQLLFTFLALASTPALAQVSPSIDRTDMPAVSTTTPVDSLRLSQASATLPATAPPLTRRGANQTWNYGALVATSQTVDRYISVAATGSAIYQFSFGALGGVNRATVASPEPLPVAIGAASPITDPYQFYAVSAAAAAVQDFRSVGFGGTLAGLQVPITYRSQAEQDIIYRFPVSFASQPDSSRSFFESPAAAAATGYLNRKRKRVNRVDAWGTLTTPFGTFQTVRIVSKLIDHDSIALGGMPGQGFDLPVTREYKWLAKTHHVPLLTITTQVIGGTEIITGVQYRDIYRRIVRLGTRDAAVDAALNAYPNPSAVGSPVALSVPAGSGPLTVTATDLVGRQLFQRHFSSPGRELVLGAEAFGSFRGVALLTISTARGTATRRVVRE